MIIDQKIIKLLKGTDNFIFNLFQEDFKKEFVVPFDQFIYVLPLLDI